MGREYGVTNCNGDYDSLNKVRVFRSPERS